MNTHQIFRTILTVSYNESHLTHHPRPIDPFIPMHDIFDVPFNTAKICFADLSLDKRPLSL